MAELKFSLRDTLLKLLDEKRYYSLRDLFNTMNPADIATVFEDIDEARLPLYLGRYAGGLPAAHGVGIIGVGGEGDHVYLFLDSPDTLAVMGAQGPEGLGGVFEHSHAVLVRADGKGIINGQKPCRVHLAPAIAAADDIFLGGGILHRPPCGENCNEQHDNSGQGGPFPVFFQSFHGSTFFLHGVGG